MKLKAFFIILKGFYWNKYNKIFWKVRVQLLKYLQLRYN